MQIVVRYAKRGKDDRETVREKVIPLRKTTPGQWNWQEFVAMAVFHKQEGERIVAIIEGGYH